MTDDFTYVHERLEPYHAYLNEDDRHDSDMRVRAYVGSALTTAQARLGDALDQPSRDALEAVLMRCMFTDQVFIRKFEHARLDEATVAALVHSDRALVELGDRARSADAGSLIAIVSQIDHEFDVRRSPEPVA